MLTIRLRPIGKKRQRSYRVVVDRNRHKLQGRNVEDLGWYNPHTSEYNLNNERVTHWLGVGAQPSDTVHNLLVRARIIKGKKIAVHSTSKKTEEEATVEATPAEAPAEAASEGEAVKTETSASTEEKEETPKEEEQKAEAETPQPAEEEKSSLETEEPKAEATEETSQEEVPEEEKKEA